MLLCKFNAPLGRKRGGEREIESALKMAPNSVRQSSKFKANCPHSELRPCSSITEQTAASGCGGRCGECGVCGSKRLIILRLRSFCLVTNSSLFRHIKCSNVNAFIIFEPTGFLANSSPVHMTVCVTWLSTVVSGRGVAQAGLCCPLSRLSDIN